MSNIKINELNTNSLNTINEEEIKQVVGGYYYYHADNDYANVWQHSYQNGTNTAVIYDYYGGYNYVDQDVDNYSYQSAYIYQ